MKITMYELLGLVKDGKAPKKIKYKSVELEYEEKNEDYCYYFNRYLFEYKFTTCNDFLNDEVEIPDEEPKKIEKLDVALLSQCDNWLRCPTNEVTKQDIELNPYIIENIRENTLYFQRKINELIDEINNLKEK